MVKLNTTLAGGITALKRVVIPCAGWWLGLVLCVGLTVGTWRPDTAQAQNPPGTVIVNTATATFAVGSRTAVASQSNQVDLTVVPVRTGSAVEL